VSGTQNKTAPSAETPRAEESKHSDYPAVHDFAAEAVLDAMDCAQWQLRSAGMALVRGNLPACVGAFEASRKAMCAAHDSLVGLMRGV
jgi:hypothetical protein